MGKKKDEDDLPKSRGENLIAALAKYRGDESYDGEGERRTRDIPTIQPWLIYDEFLMGTTPREIAVPAGVGEQEVWNDIEDMRADCRARIPGITDLDADEIRRNDLLMYAAYKDGSAQALKVAAECAQRRRDIILTTERREREKAAREERTK